MFVLLIQILLIIWKEGQGKKWNNEQGFKASLENNDIYSIV